MTKARKQRVRSGGQAEGRSGDEVSRNAAHANAMGSLLIDPTIESLCVSGVACACSSGRSSAPVFGGGDHDVESVLSDVSEVDEALITQFDSGIDIVEHSTPLFR